MQRVPPWPARSRRIRRCRCVVRRGDQRRLQRRRANRVLDRTELRDRASRGRRPVHALWCRRCGCLRIAVHDGRRMRERARVSQRTVPRRLLSERSERVHGLASVGRRVLRRCRTRRRRCSRVRRSVRLACTAMRQWRNVRAARHERDVLRLSRSRTRCRRRSVPAWFGLRDRPRMRRRGHRRVPRDLRHHCAFVRVPVHVFVAHQRSAGVRRLRPLSIRGVRHRWNRNPNATAISPRNTRRSLATRQPHWQRRLQR